MGAFPLSEGCNLDVDDRLVALIGDTSFICKDGLDDLAPGIVGGLGVAISLSFLGVDGNIADAHGVVFFVLAFSTRTGHSPNVVRRELGRASRLRVLTLEGLGKLRAAEGWDDTSCTLLVRSFEAVTFSFAAVAAFLALLFDALVTTGMKSVSDLELCSCSLVSTTSDVVVVRSDPALLFTRGAMGTSIHRDPTRMVMEYWTRPAMLSFTYLRKPYISFLASEHVYNIFKKTIYQFSCKQTCI
jgi:hypothetical protein